MTGRPSYIPHEIAATWSLTTRATLSICRASIQARQSCSAIQPPVIEAVRVPPSACSTSQSMVICCSPSACMSTTERSDRPISRWISRVRPPCLPALASRRMRSPVERGSMPYSAVTQPLPELRIQVGTFSSRLAVHSTWVSPNFTRQEPSACLEMPRSKEMARISSGWRFDGRILASLFRDSSAACSPDERAAQRKTALRRRKVVFNFALTVCLCFADHAGHAQDRNGINPQDAGSALARDISHDRRFLSARRRAARLAQPVARAAARLVAGHHPQRDERSRDARPDLLAARVGRPLADAARPALLRRRVHGDRRPHRRGAPLDRGPGEGLGERILAGAYADGSQPDAIG